MDRKNEALRNYRAEYERIRDKSKSMKYTTTRTPSTGHLGLLELLELTAPAPSKK